MPMIVQYSSEKFDRVRKRWSGELMDGVSVAERDLEDGDFYVVDALLIDKREYDDYVIDPDGSCPLPYCSLFFDVVDWRLSQWWVFHTKEQDGEGLLRDERAVRSWLAFPEWEPEPGFLEAVVDGCDEELRLFKDYQSLIERVWISFFKVRRDGASYAAA